MRTLIKKALNKIIQPFGLKIERIKKETESVVQTPLSHFDQMKLMGLKVGKNFSMEGDCIIDYAHCWLITIGDNVTFAPRVHVLAHDASTKMHLDYAKIGKVAIGNNVFVGASAIILPNVSIGNNVIVGSGSVVTKNIPDNVVVAGNPAKIICSTDEYLNKNKQLMENRPVFNGDYLYRNITDDRKQEMITKLDNGMGFVI